MKDTVIKSKRIASKDLGLVQFPAISNKYWEMKKAQQERWAKEDAEKAKGNK